MEWLKHTHEIDENRARETADAPLPEGYGRLGLTATKRLFEQLENDVVTYAEAVKASGWHHSDTRTGEILDQLPYYGEVLDRHVIPGTQNPEDDDITRFGRITNPTVHIGLNQLRRLINKIIQVHGKPDQIVVELARELKQSKEKKIKYEKTIKSMTEAAIKRSKKLEELDQKDTGLNRLLLRLWEELGPAVPRHCPYTGKVISATMLFDGSCDVDHILPYSRTLDDSPANKTLCLREANREKRKSTPWEAWGTTERWNVIEANLKNLPDNKRWRFSPDAMERFKGERDFLNRALVDTQYLARISGSYLETLYTEGGHVWTVTGRLTEMLRRHWGLNSLLPDHAQGANKAKNRTDHRHHAIDAAVVGATDRGLLNRISQAAGQEEEAGRSAEEIARDTSPPWENFRSDLRIQLERIVVSHRTDHGRIGLKERGKGRDSTTGQLHNDTAYGIVDETEVVSRTPLTSLKPKDLLVTKKGKNIRDPQLRAALEVVTAGKEGKDFEEALKDFSLQPGPYQGIRRVRLIESLQSSARVEINGPSDTPIKAYKGDSNHCYELWRMPDGKVKAQVITTFQANTGLEQKPHPAAKRILQIFKRDMVKLERDSQELICYVQKLDLPNGLFLAPHTEANADARNRDQKDAFNLIQMGSRTIVNSRLRRVFVDDIGRLRDPGPPRF